MSTYTNADKAQVFRLYDRGFSCGIIEDLTGIPENTSAYWLRRAGRIRSMSEAQVMRYNHGAYPEARARREKIIRLVRLYQEPDASCRSVGERVDLHASTVHHHLQSDYAQRLMHGEPLGSHHLSNR